MANSSGDHPHFHRFPQSKSVDSIRFLPPISPFSRFVAAAVTDPDSASSPSSIDIHSLTLDPNPNLSPVSSFPTHSKISSLKPSRTHHRTQIPLAFSTFSGSVGFLFVDPVDGSVESAVSADGVHRGAVSAVDVADGGGEAVSVGEDGRVRVVGVGEGRLETAAVGDGKGLAAYTAVRWGAPAEFATGGLGFGLRWWDRRRPGGVVSQFKGNSARGSLTGMVHSIDIHPSRKHICVVGGSSGTIFAWDLRWQQQPIMLSGVGLGGTGQYASESEVWEVQYDSHTQSSNISSAPSTRILPVMMCSEDGILSVIEQGEEPVELLAEPCAINAFDIDPQNPSDVICALEWETIGFLMRPRESTGMY
ncbi:putative nuclear pore complex protein NUP43 [Iris pallida]|uniref:Nuclear pore complex protein NUP43 n=1 Tax=Iris pallida TaxID=29817 RepID=A0AAX6G005_IRIPA|nr:putative nuclear pore complex protein NUP43 [Iris pallida]